MDEQVTHPDHATEQAYLDAAGAALAAMRERAVAAVEFGERRVEEEGTADARIAQGYLESRAGSLEMGDSTLAFGRIDEDEILANGDSWYVGRRHIENEQGDALVVDWRAPVAIPFYRATAADVQGLKLRRRFTIDGDELVAVFDEHLDDPDSVVGAGLPDPLLAEIEKSRTAEMGDIVSTIAAEQDEIIRAPLAECVIVQGGPGTGKTAVGLHRAAFLLFEHRRELATTQVLVVGPNRMFLRYVGNVLPSLGETAVSQATVQSLLDVKYRVRGVEPTELTVLKGDVRMAKVLRSAALGKLSIPDEEQRVGVGARTVTFSSEQLAQAQKTALARNVPMNDARSIYSQLLVREAKQQLLDRGVDEPGVDSAGSQLQKGPELKKLVARTWPNLGATTLVQAVLGNAALLKRASSSLFTDDERSMLQRKAAKTAKDEAWTVADLALLDEAEALCTGTSKQYGHVVVDEAQDLSAMALRVVGRRARKGSVTILGDIAQATAPAAQSSWEDVIAALGIDDSETSVRMAELTVGYRVPGPILDYANKLLPIAAPSVTPSTSVRHGGYGPLLVPVDEEELSAAVVAAVQVHGAEHQTTGVIVPAPMLADIYSALAEAGLDPVDTTSSQSLGAKLSVVDAAVAKGLEFDAVVLVEPSALLELDLPELTALRLLYVALTRAVQRLTIVHSKPLPAALS